MAGDGGAVEQVKLSFSEEDDPQSSFFYLDRIHSAQEHDDIITGKEFCTTFFFAYTLGLLALPM